MLYILIIISLLTIIFILLKTKPSNKIQLINNLIRQSSRYANASLQDENALISLFHSNYGAAYIFALRDVSSDKEVYDLTGIDSKFLTEKIVSVQDKATKNIIKLCPNIIPKDDLEKYLGQIGAEL